MNRVVVTIMAGNWVRSVKGDLGEVDVEVKVPGSRRDGSQLVR